MGRNGKKAPVFLEMIKFVNDNIGKIVTSNEILLGKDPGRNSETAYLYKFVKLGYVRPIEESFVKDKDAKFEIIIEFIVREDYIFSSFFCLRRCMSCMPRRRCGLRMILLYRHSLPSICCNRLLQSAVACLPSRDILFHQNL